MALARVELPEGRTLREKRAIIGAVSDALSVALEAPAGDPTVRLTEYPPESFLAPDGAANPERRVSAIPSRR